MTLDWPEAAGSAAHSYVCSPRPLSGVFDLDLSKHEPPDLLDLDPEFLSTLNLPRTSTDSLENEPNAMENWQMNEVFQDISVMLDAQSEAPTKPQPDDASIGQLFNDIFDSDSSSPASTSFDDLICEAGSTSLDLSSVIQETLGDSILEFELPDLMDTKSVSNLEENCSHNLEAGFHLLDELEAADAPVLAPPVDSSSVTAVASDHQYTQLASVKVKPHETHKQAIRRVKNNAASRVCRKQRKNRLTTNMEKAAELMEKNAQLRKSLSEIENFVSLLKDHLVKSTCKK